MAAKPSIIAADASHISHIAANLRPADRAELAAIGRTPEVSLSASLRLSRQAWTGMIGDEPICMFGVAPTAALTPLKGRPWMLGTSMLDSHAMAFLRRNKMKVREMLELFPYLENYVAASNVRAIEWLRWLGFSFGVAEPMGARGVLFIKFYMRRVSNV